LLADNWEWSYGFCEHGTGVYVVEVRHVHQSISIQKAC
jgi:hypothetical protein